MFMAPPCRASNNIPRCPIFDTLHQNHLLPTRTTQPGSFARHSHAIIRYKTRRFLILTDLPSCLEKRDRKTHLAAHSTNGIEYQYIYDLSRSSHLFFFGG